MAETETETPGEQTTGKVYRPEWKKDVNSNLSRKQQAIRLLVNNWPKCFFARKKDVRPVNVGIIKDLLKDEKAPEYMVRQAIRIYVKRSSYLKAVSEGSYRYGKDGKVAGAITERQRVYSRKKMEKRDLDREERENKQAQKQKDSEKKQPEY